VLRWRRTSACSGSSNDVRKAARPVIGTPPCAPGTAIALPAVLVVVVNNYVCLTNTVTPACLLTYAYHQCFNDSSDEVYPKSVDGDTIHAGYTLGPKINRKK
jgi:hypothetical protein